MLFLDYSHPTPEGNLACDELLLDWRDEGRIGNLLRVWEARESFVVLGYGCRHEDEVHTANCKKNKIPLLRRCSGGGTVLQGPGCLNYSLVLGIPDSGSLTHIMKTNEHILAQHQKALQPALKLKLTCEGTSDLAMEGLKVSGNAQRRKRRALLFHGTLLYGMNIDAMERLLAMPPRQPDYRRGRAHAAFLGNLPLSREKLTKILQECWKADEPFAPPREEDLAPLLARYGDPAWVLRI